MSQMWHRMRGLAGPIPAPEEGGVEVAEWDPGGDVVMPDDSHTRLHNPANGRVPPQLPSAAIRPKYPQFPESQYQRDFTNTPATLDAQLGFLAKSVRVDNYSSNWLYFPSAGMYIPPFVWGVMLTLDPATSVAQWTISPPLNHTNSGSLQSMVMTIWYEMWQAPSSGGSIPNT